MDIDTKEVLYSILSEMGKGRIESTIVSSPSQIPIIIREICSKCIASLNSRMDFDKPKVYSDLIEALMHYLLTVTQIPSERKVKYNNDIEISLVIPNLKQLKSDPKRTLVISFLKYLDRNSINIHIDKLLKVQPNKNNIWLVAGYYDDILDSCEGFTVFIQDDFAKGSLKPLSCIIDEIRQFVETNKIKSFKIFRT